jgi:hypothetical protein
MKQAGLMPDEFYSVVYDRLKGETGKAVKKTSECRQVYMVKPETCQIDLKKSSSLQY